MIYKIVKTILLSVACISIFEVHAQQSSIVLSDLHAGIGSESGVINTSNKYLLAEIKVTGIEGMDGLNVTIRFNNSTTPEQGLHYTILKIQEVYLIQDAEGKEFPIKDNKIQIITLMNINQNLIKTIEFTGSGSNGIHSNTLIKQF